MINAADITKSIVVILENHPDFQDVIITRSDFVNEQAERTPWIGVYRTAVEYDPATLGHHSESWQGIISVTLLVQENSLDSGAHCESKLESLLNKTLDVLWSDPTFKASIEMVTKFRVSYLYNETEEESMYFQTAKIDITGEVRTG